MIESSLAREALKGLEAHQNTMDPDKDDWKADDLKVAYVCDCECGRKNVPIYVFDQYHFCEDLIFVCKECLPTVPMKRAEWKNKNLEKVKIF